MNKNLLAGIITAGVFALFSGSVFAMPPMPPMGPQGNQPDQGGTPTIPVPQTPNDPQLPGQPVLPPCPECGNLNPTPNPTNTPGGGNPTPTPTPSNNDGKKDNGLTPAGGCGNSSVCNSNGGGGSAGPAAGSVLGLSATSSESNFYFALLGLLCLSLGVGLTLPRRV